MASEGVDELSEANAITAGLLVELPKRYRNIRVWRNNRVKTMAVGKGGKQRMISAGIDGQADISGIIGPFGRRVEVEVKAGSDRLSDAQKAFRSMILGLGGVYVEARSVEAGIAELERQLKDEEREKHQADFEGRGRPERPARTRKKGPPEPGKAVFPDYGGPGGSP